MLKKEFAAKNRYENTDRAVFGTREYAFQSNVDEENMYVIDPHTGDYMGRPKEDIEYPVLGFYLAGKVNYYTNAMVTRDYDFKREDRHGKVHTRDSYDVSLFARCMDFNPNEAELFRRNRERKPDTKTKPEHSASILAFPAPKQ